MEEPLSLDKPKRRRSRKTAARVKVVVIGDVAREDDGPILNSAESVYALPLVRDELLKSDREVFACLHLNTKNRLVSWEIASIGSLSATIVHPREVFKAAILANAAGVIFCHNHPSGDPEPSLADIELTRRLAKAGDVLGIDVFDHLIVTDTGFASLDERGIL
jgi:DNA repair protein RadC